MQRFSKTCVLALVFACAAFASPACDDDTEIPPPVELRGDGARAKIGLVPFQISILDGSGKEVLRTLTGGGRDAYGAPAATRDDGLDNIKIIPGWDGYLPDERPWAHGARARLVARTDASASFELDVGAGKLAIDVAIEGAKVKLKTTATAGASGPSDAWNKTSLAFALGADEHFFGLGERFASVDHRGLSMYAWAEEGGSGKGEKVPAAEQNPFPNGPSMTYFPVPFFLSSAGYAVHLATTYRTETHFGSERKDAWRVAANTNTLETVVYVHDDPLASLDDFTRETGRPMVPASWVFGPRRRVSNGDRVGDMLEWRKLREAHVPTTGLDDAVHLLPARSEIGREAELLAWTRDAHAWGFKVMAYNNPYVSLSKASAGTDLAYGKDRGLFALTSEGAVGETFFISGEPQTLATIDLTKAAAVAWFQDLLRRTLALGYDGWMHDFGEYVRRSWTFGDGRKGDELHNAFPVLSAKAAYELLSRERPNDFLFFVRSGYTGTQQWVPAVWSGDPEATFDETQGLPAMVRGGLNLGMSGVPLWGSDVTGFKCITEFPYDKEMYLRWAEFGAVSPIMMEQNACANPLGRRQKWKLWNDAETVSVYSDMARLHTRLLPYFEVLARESNRSGIPIMRHPFLHHPRDPEAWKAESAFYLGASLWAAPVVERGATTKDTWLPPGKWVDLVDRAVYEGGRRSTLPAPLARLPLLLKDGGIVPMLDPSIDTLAPATEPGVVTLDQVKDRLDVVVALSVGRDAKIVLVDGTELVARRAAASAPLSALPEVAPDSIAACEGGCVNTSVDGAVDRLRVTTPLAPEYSVTHGDVTLEVRGGPLARRIRWDVMRLR
jgi:alpha-glucosidase (family GH31 glycosyl hydrolase)